MPTPVVVIAAGGVPIVNTSRGTPMTPVSDTIGGMPVTIVDENPPNRGFPVYLVNDDLTEWVPAFATGALSFSGQANDGELVTIGATVYRFVTVLAVAYDVLIGVIASASILNLIAAVNAGAGEGTEYGTGTIEHPDVTASDAPGVMNVTAKVAGTGGNSIVTTDTVANASWGAGTLQGGA